MPPLKCCVRTAGLTSVPTVEALLGPPPTKAKPAVADLLGPAPKFESNDEFRQRMDQTYGAGRWRDTGDLSHAGQRAAVGGPGRRYGARHLAAQQRVSRRAGGSRHRCLRHDPAAGPR